MKPVNRRTLTLFLLLATWAPYALYAQKFVTILNSSGGRATFIKYDIFGNYKHYPLGSGEQVQIDIKNDPFINLLALENDKNVPYFFFPGDKITVTNNAQGLYTLKSDDPNRTTELDVSKIAFMAMQQEFLWKRPFKDLKSAGDSKIDSIIATKKGEGISSHFKELIHRYYAYDLLARKFRNGGEDPSIAQEWLKDLEPLMISQVLGFRSYILNHLSKTVEKDQLLAQVAQRYQGLAREVGLYTIMHMAFYRDKPTFRSQYNNYMSLSADAAFKDKLAYFKLTDDMAGTSSQVTLADPKGATLDLQRVLESLKGKVVLIDLWASWCVPCLEQMPYSAALTEKYAKQPFQVLYLSMDRELQLFKDASVKYIDGKVNFNVLSNFTSSFATLHKVSALPRYMLMDKQGNLVDTNTPTPSNKALQELIEKYL